MWYWWKNWQVDQWDNSAPEVATLMNIVCWSWQRKWGNSMGKGKSFQQKILE